MGTTFASILEANPGREIEKRIGSVRKEDVHRALKKNGRRSIDDFIALISPWGGEYLEEIALKSRELTQKRFGKTIQLFVPMYLSNECQNICTYCGFSYSNKVKRTTLSDEEIIKEALILKNFGFDHLLLVSGEANSTVNTEYFVNALKLLKNHFSYLSLEVQPLKTDEYKLLRKEGLHAVLVYQETYDRALYSEVHPKGKKSNFYFRLETPERLGTAQVHKIGLGVLLGLSDFRIDAVYLAMHLEFLRKKFWKSAFSISFPRLRPASGVDLPHSNYVSDRDFIHLVSAFRVFDEDVELSLSTREVPEFRDQILPLGFTSMSAGSRTDPGSYSRGLKVLEQFEISDTRSPLEVANRISELGYDPVWKNWDEAYGSSAALG